MDIFIIARFSFVESVKINYWVGHHSRLTKTHHGRQEKPKPETSAVEWFILIGAFQPRTSTLCLCVKLEKSSCNQQLSGWNSTAALSLSLQYRSLSLSLSAASYSSLSVVHTLSSSLPFLSLSLYNLLFDSEIASFHSLSYILY